MVTRFVNIVPHKIQKWLLIIYSIFTFTIVNSQDSLNLFSPNIYYISDAGRNFSGGLKTGNAYMGMANIGLNISTERFWTGGSFYFELKNTHGHNLSENYIGDMQVVSNIENGNFTFLSQMYFTQTFKSLKLLAGIHDLNTEFVVCDHACALTNSSFGIPSIFPMNFSTPIYPKPSLALIANYEISEKMHFRTAFYDGNAGTLDEDPHNLNWNISREEGILSINEFAYNSKLFSTKLGFYYHSGKFSNYSDTSKQKYGNYGIYLLSEETVYKTGDKSIGVFNQLAYAPGYLNFNKLYLGAGANLNGFVLEKYENTFSVGFAYAQNFDNSFEYDLECNFLCKISDHFHIQPCIHYIVNPGANSNVKNGFAAFLRTSLYL